MQQLSLYGLSQMVTVSVNQGPVSLCVSRVPPRDATLGKRGRLVMLHGNPANMHDFNQLASLLQDEFEILALDLPGFGRSDNVRPVIAESVLDTYARHIVAAVNGIGWTGELHVLGHSHGAAVAQTIAALYPERVSALILLGSVGTPAHWGYRQLVMPGTMSALRVIAKSLKRAIPRPLRWRIVQAVMEPIFSPHPLAHSWIDEQLENVENRPEILVNMALVATGDPCGQLARAAELIRAPTLFIHGSSDKLVPSMYARSVYELLVRSSVRAEFYELPDTGHMLHISHPKPIRALIIDWLNRLPRAQRSA